MAAIPVAAAFGEIEISQKAPLEVQGSWTLVKPNGSRVTGDEKTQTISSVRAGKYVLSVLPPLNAYTIITVTNNDVVVFAENTREASFNLTEGADVKIELAYSYNSTVEVESIPSGVSFRLTYGQSQQLTGRTPAVFEDMPSVQYTAYFASQANCEVPRPIHRTVEPNQTIKFMNIYDCDADRLDDYLRWETVQPLPTEVKPRETAVEPLVIALPDVSEPVVAVPVREPVNVRLMQTVSNNEILPGQSATVSISLTNIGDKTLYEIEVRDLFDPEIINVPFYLPAEGYIRSGNIMVWEIDQLEPGSTWQAEFPVSLQTDLESGRHTRLTASVAGDSIRYEASAVTVGMPVIPVTGAPYDIVFLIISVVSALGLFGLSCYLSKKQ